jgi:hypothetical protein
MVRTPVAPAVRRAGRLAGAALGWIAVMVLMALRKMMVQPQALAIPGPVHLQMWSEAKIMISELPM